MTSRATTGSPKRSRRSRPPPSAAAVVLAAFAEVVRPRGLRWYLFGAQAVAVYGVLRTSADVDVTLELPAGDLRAFVKEMKLAGFAVRVPDVADFVASTRTLPFLHKASSFPLDVVLAGPGLEEAFLDAVRELRFEGVSVPVLAAEDLIVTKILAGRPKDLEDVRRLLVQPGVKPDLGRARRLLGALDDALGQNELLRCLDTLARKRSR